jgi:hypothetical protein
VLLFAAKRRRKSRTKAKSIYRAKRRGHAEV